MRVVYKLYKKPVQLETLAIVQYLDSLGVDARPMEIYERSYPPVVTALPAIYDVDADRLHLGLPSEKRGSCSPSYTAESAESTV